MAWQEVEGEVVEAVARELLGEMVEIYERIGMPTHREMAERMTRAR